MFRRTFQIAAHRAKLLCAAAIAFVASAQEPVFRSGVNLVVVDVAVETRSGEPISGLTSSNFRVKENGQEREIEQFDLGSAHISLAVVVDFSASMRTRRAQVVTSVSSLSTYLTPEDEAALSIFNDHPKVIAPMSPFASGTGEEWRSMLLSAQPEGRTALYDAILAARQQLAGASFARKVIVLLSDGSDNNSSASLRDVAHQLQASNYLLYAVGMFRPGEPDTNAGALRELASATGGLAIFEKDPTKLSAALSRVMQDLRSRYVLAFRSDLPGAGQAEIRKLEITARDENGKKLKVRARGEYLTALSGELPGPGGIAGSNTGTNSQSNP